MLFKAPALLGFALLASRVEALALTTLSARSTTDICANVNAQLKVPFLGIDVAVGLLDICLCLDDIPDLLHSNGILVTAVGIVGEAAVTAAVTDMVNSAADHKKCTFPDHATPHCALSNSCGFDCKDGYTASPAKNPTDCLCIFPFKVCNGICGKFGSVCPSSTPKKREVEVLQRRAEASCDLGLTACGVYGWQGFDSSEAWECIDTTSDLESCGGCTVAFGRHPARGIDCTSIPGVMDVACASGSCLIRRCLPGWDVSFDGSYCVRKNAGDAMAVMYGLEHVPLKRNA